MRSPSRTAILDVEDEHAAGREGDPVLHRLLQGGLLPKASIGWEEPDAQKAFINGDIAMLIGGRLDLHLDHPDQAGA